MPLPSIKSNLQTPPSAAATYPPSTSINTTIHARRSSSCQQNITKTRGTLASIYMCGGIVKIVDSGTAMAFQWWLPFLNLCRDRSYFAWHVVVGRRWSSAGTSAVIGSAFITRWAGVSSSSFAVIVIIIRFISFAVIGVGCNTTIIIVCGGGRLRLWRIPSIITAATAWSIVIITSTICGNNSNYTENTTSSISSCCQQCIS